MEPLFNLMAKDPDYRCFLRVGPNQKRFLGIFLLSRKKSIEEKFRGLPIQITDSWDGFDIVVCGDTLKHASRYGAALLCNVDHGPCTKTLRYRNLLKQPDISYIVCAEGPYRLEKLKKYRLDKSNVVIDVGLPKLDPFFDGTFSKEKIMGQYGLDPAKKTVLYAPTYKPTSIFSVGPALAALGNEYNVVVKLHPYSWAGKYASHSHHRFFERMVKNNPAVTLIPRDDHNILPLLFVADTMISEGSSVINEFLALERVGILFDLDDDNLNHSDGQPLLEERTTEWLKDSFIHISSGTQLKDAVYEALNPSPARQQMLKRDKEFLYSRTDGASGALLKKELEKMVAARKHDAA